MQYIPTNFIEERVGIVAPPQLALALHNPDLQHFGFRPDVRGVSLRARRPGRAQVLDVVQPQCGPIVTAIVALLDHRQQKTAAGDNT